MEPVYLDYASGALSPAARLLIGAHLTMRPDPRGEAQLWDTVGGGLLETLGEPVSELSRARALKLIAKPATPAAAPPPATNGLPAPLARAIGQPLETLKWTSPMPGMREWVLPEWPDARLLRLKPGGGIPEHGHTGRELTLVLHGAYSDGVRVLGPGDLEVADEALWHAPEVVGETECLCLAVLEGRYRLRGWNRLLAAFTGFRGRLA